jgi:hypothetical protein
MADPESHHRNKALAEAQAEAEENPRDETVPGGRYKVNGQWVNADGKVLEGPDEGVVVQATTFTGTEPPPDPEEPPPARSLVDGAE